MNLIHMDLCMFVSPTDKPLQLAMPVKSVATFPVQVALRHGSHHINGLPSNLPELVQSLDDGGLVFDPHSVEAIANAIDVVMSSPDRQTELENKAVARKNAMSWKPFVEMYRKAYAYAAGQ